MDRATLLTADYYWLYCRWGNRHEVGAQREVIPCLAKNRIRSLRRPLARTKPSKPLPAGADRPYPPSLRRYLGILKSSLLNEIYIDLEARLLYIFYQNANGAPVSRDVVRDIRGKRPDLVQYIVRAREVGNIAYLFTETINGVSKNHNFRDVCEFSHTMIGRLRLENLEQCLDAVRIDRVPGDLIETGVWRGGACIFMRGYLEAYAMRGRRVWVADSFQGLPKPTHPADEAYDYSREVEPSFAISLDEVKENFRRYGLLDEQVIFLEGWFKDTLPSAPVQELALISSGRRSL